MHFQHTKKCCADVISQTFGANETHKRGDEEKKEENEFLFSIELLSVNLMLLCIMPKVENDIWDDNSLIKRASYISIHTRKLHLLISFQN
jgi:hypothetical protein